MLDDDMRTNLRLGIVLHVPCMQCNGLEVYLVVESQRTSHYGLRQLSTTVHYDHRARKLIRVICLLKPESEITKARRRGRTERG
jgi:hypothetical protein